MTMTTDNQSFALLKKVKGILDKPETRPSLPLTPGDLRYSRAAFLCTHNSFTNYQDARWASASQSRSIANQLKEGVRALMLDTYYKEPGSGDVFKVIPEKGVYLLHGVDERGWIAGFTYALPSQRLYKALEDVVNFLKQNPTEVVTIFLEDYTETNQLKNELEKVEGLKELIYDPDNDENWRVKDQQEWPLLSDMIDWNKRLVIFSSKNHKNKVKKIGIAYDRDYTKQNYWSIGDLGNDLSCPSRWNNGEYIDADYPKLFVFNHYRNTPTVITAAIDNKYDKIMNRIDNECCRTAKQLPNFVAVDFYEVPLETEDKAQKVVAELNRRWKNNELCYLI